MSTWIGYWCLGTSGFGAGTLLKETNLHWKHHLCVSVLGYCLCQALTWLSSFTEPPHCGLHTNQRKKRRIGLTHKYTKCFPPHADRWEYCGFCLRASKVGASLYVVFFFFRNKSQAKAALLRLKIYSEPLTPPKKNSNTTFQIWKFCWLHKFSLEFSQCVKGRKKKRRKVWSEIELSSFSFCSYFDVFVCEANTETETRCLRTLDLCVSIVISHITFHIFVCLLSSDHFCFVIQSIQFISILNSFSLYCKVWALQERGISVKISAWY